MSLLSSLVSQVIDAKKPRKERKNKSQPIPCFADYEEAMKGQGWMTVAEVFYRLKNRTKNSAYQCLRFTLEPRKLVESRINPDSSSKNKTQYRWVE